MLVQVIRVSLDQTPLTEKDAGLSELALTYAQAIDDGADLSKLGPALLATLEALLMSPRARAAAKKAVTDDKPIANPIDQLANRRAGKSAAAAMDAAAP